MTAKSANGVRGHLLYIHCDNKYVFRVYDLEHNFMDYDLHHCDLCVTIDDADAYFYQRNGQAILDHAPMTLGIEDDS